MNWVIGKKQKRRNRIKAQFGKNPMELEAWESLEKRMREIRMYEELVVRKNNEISGNLEDAIEKAINQCMEENVLRDFLAQHREEVMHVMTLDYTFERRLEMQRAEAIEDGERIGKEIGKEEKLSEQIRKKIQKGKPLDQIADELEEVPETIRPLYEKIKQEMLQ